MDNATDRNQDFYWLKDLRQMAFDKEKLTKEEADGVFKRLGRADEKETVDIVRCINCVYYVPWRLKFRCHVHYYCYIEPDQFCSWGKTRAELVEQIGEDKVLEMEEETRKRVWED